MLSRGVNYWISWADLTFMLFVAGLAAIAVSDEHRATAEEELKAVQGRLAEMERTSNPCLNADEFLTGFSACVAERTGRRQVPRSGCFVTVGEDVIRFANAEAVPEDASAADAVSGCLYQHARQFAASRPDSFAAITIHIDGHTDYVGKSGSNQLLGAERAMSVYSRVLALAEGNPAWSDADRTVFLRRFAVRSFGETRPADGSSCAKPEGCKDDRRVVVSVQLATERAES